MLSPHFLYKSIGEKLFKYQENSLNSHNLNLKGGISINITRGNLTLIAVTMLGLLKRANKLKLKTRNHKN